MEIENIIVLNQEIDTLNSKAWSLNREDAQQAIDIANIALQLSLHLDYKNGIASANVYSQTNLHF